MVLTLNQNDADLLRGLLEDHLPEIKREAARTDRHELRHLLVQRQELMERLLTELGSK
jgi:hypothetical protein